MYVTEMILAKREAFFKKVRKSSRYSKKRNFSIKILELRVLILVNRRVFMQKCRC
jgi:hypothetical protein